jgi:hypothetical protein
MDVGGRGSQQASKLIDREDGSVAITIDDLRRDWRRGIEMHDKMIAHLERAMMDPFGQDTAWPAKIWLDKLCNWRAELKSLLLDFPGEE